MVVKNKKKFVRGILLIIGVTIGLVLLMTGKAFSHEELRYKTVSVISGDTLWDIAQKEQNTNSYYNGYDVRDIISNIKKVNNLKSSTLSDNQVLEIPTY